MEEEVPEVVSGDDVGEALGHADASASEGVFDGVVLFLEPAEEGAEGGQVAFDAGFFERADVEEVADVVVDDRTTSSSPSSTTTAPPATAPPRAATFLVNSRGAAASPQMIRCLPRLHGRTLRRPRPRHPHMFRHSVATYLVQEVDIRYV